MKQLLKYRRKSLLKVGRIMVKGSLNSSPVLILKEKVDYTFVSIVRLTVYFRISKASVDVGPGSLNFVLHDNH